MPSSRFDSVTGTMVVPTSSRVASSAKDGKVGMAVKRTRKSRPKSKSGCITCKIRRIKCDEEHPHCLKCTSTGRKCDGYSPPEDRASYASGDSAPPSAKVIATPWNPLLDYQGTPMEHRYLIFFHRQTAPVLSGYFDSHFWSGLLLQLAHWEPTIQHAMMAVASIHEQVEFAGKDLSRPRLDLCGMNHGFYFALDQYSKAISCLNKRLTDGPQSEEVALMCCVLFICLEFMRGNVETAVSHMHGGLEIITEWRAKSSRRLSDESLPITPDPSSLPDTLAQIFSRLSIQSFLCGRIPPCSGPKIPDRVLSVSTPAVFSSLQDARTSLDYLMKVSLQFLKEANNLHDLVPGDQRRERLLDSRSAIIAQLDKWSSAFDLFLVSSSINRTRLESRAATNLRILNIVAKIWLSCCMHEIETAFDDQTEAFSYIISLASTVSDDDLVQNSSPEITDQRASKENPRRHTFTFEMGLIPPLYFTAMKCRLPSIRRAAIAQLDSLTPRREGIWIADLYAAVARRIIAIEEEDLDVVGVVDEKTREKRPPESKRVYDAVIHPRGEDTLTERVQKVTFKMSPYGKEGEYTDKEEEIRW